MTVTIDPEDESVLHRMVIESVEFDIVDKEVFFVDSSLPFTADAKVVDFAY